MIVHSPRSTTSALLTLLVFLFVAPALAVATDLTVTFNSGAYGGRHYRLHYVSGEGGCSIWNVAVVLHGGGMDETGLSSGNDARLLFGMEPEADDNCVAIAYPLALNPGGGRQWNFMPEMAAWGYTADDVGFINAVIADALANRLTGMPVNTDNITGVGFSGSAALLAKMYCEGHSGYFHRLMLIAPVFSEGQQARCTLPSSGTKRIVIFHGTADPAVPWNGSMHWPSNEVFDAAVLPAWGPGSLYEYLVDLMGVTVSSDYYVSGIFPDYDVNGCGDYCGTGTSYVMFRSPSAGYTNSYSVYSFAMSGPCTGGGWNQGSCDYPLAGAGHRVDSAICARGDYCGASHAGVGKTPFMFSVDSNVFIRHIITGSLY